MKIWLDDLRDPRAAHFHLEYVTNDEDYIASWKESDVVWLKESKACIQALETGKVTQISLDHDLGPYGCGLDVANWIEQAAFEGRIPRLVWSVHSANPVGSRAMRAALQNADRFWSESNSSGVSRAEGSG